MMMMNDDDDDDDNDDDDDDDGVTKGGIGRGNYDFLFLDMWMS